MTTTSADNGIGTDRKGKTGVTPLPEHPRSGVSADQRARQYTCRVGYDLRDNGERARSFQYLTADPDEATLRHIALEREWGWIKGNWAMVRTMILPGLPENLRTADTSKPFWIKPEWSEKATKAMKDAMGTFRTFVANKLMEKAQGAADQIDGGKATLAKFTDQQPGEPDLLAMLPNDLKARVLQALQPAANEVTGTAPDAKPMTIRQCADAFYEYKAEKIGLHIPGLKRGGGVNVNTYNGVKRELDYALKLLNEADDLRTLTHDRLERFRDDAYRTAKKPRTAWNRCKALKAMLDWAGRNKMIQYKNVETIDEVFGLARPETTRKTAYSDETAAKLKAIRKSAEAIVEKKGQEVWPFVLLAMNTAAYQVDISDWTYDNLKTDQNGTHYLWWQRRKTRHQNETLWTRHDLWAETWEAMQKVMAPDDPAKNPTRRLFLNSDGGPMYHTAKDKARGDVIGQRYKRACKKATNDQGESTPIDLPFMQLRKVALNAIKKAAGGSDDVTRKFAGQKVPGILKAYLEDDFADVSTALAKWREQLAADSVLIPKKTDAAPAA